NRVRITRDVEEVEIAVNQTLRPHDPETDRGQAEHDRIMHRDAEPDRYGVKQDRHRSWDDTELRQGNANDHTAEGGVDDAVEAELFGRDGKLTVDRQDQERVQFSGTDQLRNSGDVDEKERLEKLRDHLMGADEQNHFPFCPIADPVDIAENDREKSDLPDEPQHFHQHPKQEIRFETQLADERVAQHDGVNLDVT